MASIRGRCGAYFRVSGGANAEAPERVPTLVPGVLSVGTYFVNPPFEYVSDARKVGFEVDLIREVARRLHLKTSFVNTRWEVILQQMQEGRYDCIVGGITITPTRQVTLAWSDPYMTTTLSLVINSTKTPQIHSLVDLKDAEVGVQAATTDYASRSRCSGAARSARSRSIGSIGSPMR
jgi:ABC-type amino acid transport substrate-binding protein